MLGPVDVSLFRWFNGAGTSPILDQIFRFFSFATRLNSVRMALAILVIAMIARNARTRAAAFLTMLAWPLANALSDIFKSLLPAGRPCAELTNVRLLTDYAGNIYQLGSSGTMSAHAANMAAVAMVMTLKLKWWGVPWIVVALLTGISRIYLGVHYPSQVLLGWIGGMLCGWIVVKTWDAYTNRKSVRNANALPE